MTNRHGNPPGDELLPGANMTFDRTATIDATPRELWPWIVQLGKQRAGWYLPARLEHLLPADRRPSRTIEPQWQTLTIGDRIPDYGGRHEWLEVARMEAPHILVYRSERRNTRFTWALLLSSSTDRQTELRLRFRGQLNSTGLIRHIIVNGGDLFDWSTGALMVAGLNERIAKEPRVT